MSPPSEREQLSFLTNLQRLLSEGQFVATYKYALLLALCDMAVEQGDDSGQPLLICTRHIAEKFIQYYWQQTAPYPISPERAESRTNAILRQNTGNQAAIINYVSSARASYPTLADLRRDARMWHQLVRQVDRVIRVMPLWKLQTVGRQSFDFLYENRMTGNAIELRPGVAFCLRRFYPLVNDLVRVPRITNAQPEQGRQTRGFRASERLGRAQPPPANLPGETSSIDGRSSTTWTPLGRLHPGPTARPPAQARSPGCAAICLFMWSRPGWRF